MSGYRSTFIWLIILIVVFLSACGDKATTDNKLILISPHQESIKKEMTDGFKSWYKAKHGADVELEWLDQGGTTNAVKFIRSKFERNPDNINRRIET